MITAPPEGVSDSTGQVGPAPPILEDPTVLLGDGVESEPWVVRRAGSRRTTGDTDPGTPTDGTTPARADTPSLGTGLVAGELEVRTSPGAPASATATVETELGDDSFVAASELQGATPGDKKPKK
jgi:hypothetical protein